MNEDTHIVPMNRTQRRLMQRASKRADAFAKASTKNRAAMRRIVAQKDLNGNRCKTLEILTSCREYSEDEIMRVHINIMLDFDLLRKGGGSPEKMAAAYNRLALHLSLQRQRAAQVDASLDAVFSAAHDAMDRYCDRVQEAKRWAFDGPGLQSVTDALELSNQLFANSSPRQVQLIANALAKEVRNRVKDKKPMPAHIVPMLDIVPETAEEERKIKSLIPDSALFHFRRNVFAE